MMTIRRGKDERKSGNASTSSSFISRFNRRNSGLSSSSSVQGKKNKSKHNKNKPEVVGSDLVSSVANMRISTASDVSTISIPIVPMTPRNKGNSTSLGVGYLSPDGRKISSFVPSPNKSSHRSSRSTCFNDDITLGSSFSRSSNSSSPRGTCTSTGRQQQQKQQISTQLQQQSRSLYNYLQQKSHDAAEKLASTAAEIGPQVPIIFRRGHSSFFRVADLDLPDDIALETMSIASTTNSTIVTDEVPSTSSESYTNVCMAQHHHQQQQQHTNFFSASVDPPPGIEHDPDEKWVALDNGAGSFAPIAPYAIQALVKTAFKSLFDESMWIPYSSKQFKANPWHQVTWQKYGSAKATDLPSSSSKKNNKEEQEIFIWSGKFNHRFYGNDIPAIRSAAIMHMSSKELCDMLIDSSRVCEYNKYSIGREDILILQDNISSTLATTSTATTSSSQETQKEEEDGTCRSPLDNKSVTKVMRARSVLPPIPFVKSTTIELTTLMHACELEGGAGYILVTRAVTHPSPCGGGGGGVSSGNDCDNNSKGGASSAASNVLRSEILMGVNLIRNVEGDQNRCLMINVCHVRSPMVPMSIAMRMGASAASNFIKDVRSVSAN